MTTTAARQPRTREVIEAEIAAARTRLGDSVEQLITEVHPRAIAARTVDDAKAFAAAEFAAAKRQVKDETGWRTDRLVMIASAVAGLAAFGLIVRGLRRR